MADRVSASITVGGVVDAPAYVELSEIIVGEGLSTEWDGERFEPHHRTVGEPLSLYAHEVAWGRFDELEAWCVGKSLPFVRWSGSYPGRLGAKRVVFTGQGEPRSYAADDDDEVVIDRATVEQLGSFEAIIAHFEAADFEAPPLVVDGDTPPIELGLGRAEEGTERAGEADGWSGSPARRLRP
jgi:hypothetical protein